MWHNIDNEKYTDTATEKEVDMIDVSSSSVKQQTAAQVMVVNGPATRSNKADSSRVVVEKKVTDMVDVSSSPAEEQTTEVICGVSSSTKMDQMPAHGTAACDNTDKHSSGAHFEK
eukprot:2975468-Ditylum_brightwellii.AAC.1